MVCTPVFRGVTPNLDEKSAIEGTVDYLRKAVHRQMVADVPVGAFLSGGLDSSSVVAFAREFAPDIRCFTIEAVGGAEAGTADDLPYARRVAAHLGVSLDVVSVDASRMAADIEYMIAQLDEPLADPAPLNVFFISRLAREHGMKVLLSGAGGDDLLPAIGATPLSTTSAIGTGYPKESSLRLNMRHNRLISAALFSAPLETYEWRHAKGGRSAGQLFSLG